jgi:hypothetical protein
MSHAEEPAIPTKVMLETMSPDGWQAHPAVIADLTRDEVWIQIDEPIGQPIDPGSRVRLALSRLDEGVRTAETCVLWCIGHAGMLVVLMRPTLWDPPSRRTHGRAWLAIPASLHHESGEPPLSVRTTNVGVGGFFCVSDRPVAEGSQLPVSLRLTPAESFDCRAEVVRAEGNPDDPSGRETVLGFRFLDLSREEEARLASAIVALAQDVDENDVPRPWRSIEGTPAAGI